MNREIAELREVITKLVPLLTGKGLRVTQRGSRAYVRADTRTNKPFEVNIPSIPDNAKPDFIEAVAGFIDHEVAHVLFTDWALYGGDGKKVDKFSAEGKALTNIHNIIEDTMIERRIVQTFPGSERNLDRLHKHFLEKITNPAVKNAHSEEEKFAYIIVPMMRALSGQQIFKDWMDAGDYWKLPMVENLHMAMSSDSLKTIAKAMSTKESLEVAWEVHDILFRRKQREEEEKKKQEEAAKQKQQQAQQSQQSQQQSSEEEGKSEDKPEKQAGAGNGTGERKHDEEGEEDAGEGEGSGATGSKEEDEQEEDEAGKGEGSETGDEEENNEEEGGDAKNEPSDEGDDEADDEGHGAGDGDDDGEEEASGEGDEGEPDEEEAAGEEAGGDGEQDEEGVNDGAELGDEEGEEYEDIEGDKTGGVDEESQGQNDSGFGGESGKSMFEMDPSKFAPLDLSEAMAQQIEDMASQSLKSSSYSAFTKDEDQIAPFKFDPALLGSDWVSKMDEKVQSLIGPMQKEIERMMAAQSLSVRTSGHRSGRLHSASLYRVLQGDPRVFQRKEEHRSKDTAVTLLVDNSGSMGGAKIVTAMQSAYALAQTLERVGISCEVLGFTTGALSRAAMQQFHEEYAKGVYYHRTSTIVMPIYKDFAERVTPTVKARIAFQCNRQVGLNNNTDGESLEYAALRLLPRREKRKVMIVLSDGMPVGSGTATHLADTVTKLTKMGIETVGIGINSNAVEKFYPRSLVLNRVEDLPAAVMGELRRILSN